MEERSASSQTSLAPAGSTSGFAVASFVLSLVGLLVVPFIPSVLAVVFGHVARSSIKRSRGAQTGGGLAVAGLIIGYIGVAVWILLFALIIGMGFFAAFHGMAGAKLGVTEAQIGMFEHSLKMYHMKHDAYPGESEGLQALVDDGQLQMIPLDPWGNPFEYRFPGSQGEGSYDIISYGKDGLEGGEGADADISNWTINDTGQPQSTIVTPSD